MSRNRDVRRREWATQRAAEEQELYERIQAVWQVPEHAAEEFVKMEDAIGERGATAVADFVKAMLEARGA